MAQCVDCSKEVSRYAERCCSCAAKRVWSEGNHISCRPGTNLLPSRVRELSSTEAAWVGAMIEGEGSIIRSRNRPRRPPIVQLGSTAIETIATLLRLVGAGSVYYRRPPCGKHQEVWEWALFRQQEVRDLLQQVRPFLTSKRDLAEVSLEVG